MVQFFTDILMQFQIFVRITLACLFFFIVKNLGCLFNKQSSKTESLSDAGFSCWLGTDHLALSVHALKGKQLERSKPNLGRPIIHGRSSAWTHLEVQRSKVKERSCGVGWSWQILSLPPSRTLLITHGAFTFFNKLMSLLRALLSNCLPSWM